VCPDKKKGDHVATAVHDFEGHQTYVERLGHQFLLNATFDEVNAADYDGLYIPGGRAPEYLRLNEKVILLVKHFLDTNKPLAAICHGPQILVATGGIQGRKVTAYFAQEPELRAVGADYQKVGVDEAVVDGNLVTGVAWPANPAVIRAFVELLGVKIVHQ